MLQNTFLHIPYVNERTEKMLWNSQVNSWDDFLEKMPDVKNQSIISNYIALSKENLEKKNPYFFSQRLLSKYHWRAYDEFKDNCCFLDIETTGLSKARNHITTIGIYNGQKSKVFVQGIDLDEFKAEVSKYSMIVTFNGSMFDLPFIRHHLGIDFPQFHIDLRYFLKNLGYSGGLKKIEKEFGLARETEGVDGLEAVRLWHRYKRGDKNALNLLVKYNIEDIENLKILMEEGYSMACKKCSLPSQENNQ